MNCLADLNCCGKTACDDGDQADDVHGNVGMGYEWMGKDVIKMFSEAGILLGGGSWSCGFAGPWRIRRLAWPLPSSLVFWVRCSLIRVNLIWMVRPMSAEFFPFVDRKSLCGMIIGCKGKVAV